MKNIIITERNFWDKEEFVDTFSSDYNFHILSSKATKLIQTKNL